MSMNGSYSAYDALFLPSAKLGSVTRKINEIKLLLEIEPPIERNVILEQYTNLGSRVDSLELACDEEFKKKLSDPDRDKLVEWQLKYQTDLSAVKESLQSWLRKCKRGENSKEVDEKKPKQKEKFEKKVAELEKQLNELKLLNSSQVDRNSEESEQPGSRLDTASFANSLQASQVESLKEIVKEQGKIAALIAKGQQKAQLPCHEPETFDGKDLTKFRPFLRCFVTNIEQRCDNDCDRLHYLEKYTAGSARELVRSCFGNNDGYQTAIALLKKRYDNEFKLAECYLAQLEKFPVVKSEDCDAIEKLFLLLTICCNAMKNLSTLNQLNSPKEIMSIVKKLPYRLREKWRSQVHALTEQDIIPKFEDLVHFVEWQSAIWSEPVFGDIRDAKNVQVRENPKPKNFVVSRETSVKDSNISDRKDPCICCKKIEPWDRTVQVFRENDS